MSSPSTVLRVRDARMQEILDAIDGETILMALAIVATVLLITATIGLTARVWRELGSRMAVDELDDDAVEEGLDAARKKGASRIRSLGKQLGRRKGHDKLRTSDAEVGGPAR